jgi:biotin transport system substrate-specific component
MSHPLFIDAIRPVRRGRAAAYDALLVAGFSLLIGLGAQVSFPLPFTPVPVTLQTFAVLMAGCALGSRRGALAVLAYLEEGFAGLPVFSAGTAGIAHLFGPTGGYLVGFVAAAFVVGLGVERGAARRWPGRLAVLVAGSMTLYVPGVIWLGAFTGIDTAVTLGFMPFVVGDALKVVAGWALLTVASKNEAR